MYVEREELDLSVIFPCLNEAECVGQCVRDAKAFMEEENIRGEVLVVDNGSRDDSARQARSCGARVLYEKDTGYGNAIRCGLSKSRGQVVIFADCDIDRWFETGGSEVPGSSRMHSLSDGFAFIGFRARGSN